MNRNFQRQQQQQNRQRQQQQRRNQEWWDHRRRKKEREREEQAITRDRISPDPPYQTPNDHEQVLPNSPGGSLLRPKPGLPTDPVPKFTPHLHSRRQWKILPNRRLFKAKVRPERFYRLYSHVRQKSLVFKGSSAKNGIDLSWERGLSVQPNISFEPKSGSQKPIKYDQQVAIRVEGPGGQAYLRCRMQKGEMELTLSQKPRYEWRVGGGEARKSVKTATIVSLFNTVAQDYLDETWV